MEEFVKLEMRKLMTLLMPFWKNPNPELSEPVLVKGKEFLCKIKLQTKQEAQNFIIITVKSILKSCSKEHSHSKRIRIIITDIFKILFDGTRVDSLQNFMFVYYFLLKEIYDPTQSDLTANVNEEYKLSVVQCATLLAKAVTGDLTKSLYTASNGLNLCEMMCVVIGMAKYEQLRTLRLASIECIMSLVKVDDTADCSDMEIRDQIADIFIHFAPRIISILAEIAVEDEKHGHTTALLAIRAWGRIVTLIMQNYKAFDEELINQTLQLSLEPTQTASVPRTKWKTKEELQEYLNTTKRTPAWYRSTDSILQNFMAKFKKLTSHSNQKVRFELVDACSLLIENCSMNMPITIGRAIENLIILSEDEDTKLSGKSLLILSSVSEKFSMSIYKNVLENLEENFYGAIASLPRIFSGLDEKEQLSAINLLVGYLQLFGKTKLAQVLHSTTHLKRLIQSLIHISELESKNVSLYEEYMIQDLDLVADYRTPWKNFHYFSNTNVQNKVQKACALLAKCNVLDITTDLLLDIFMNSEENRKEASLILNDLLTGVEGNPSISDNMYIITNVIDTYLDPEYWNLELDISYMCMLPQVQNNVIQICLQLEGLSKIALAIGTNFERFLLKVLYPILECAGSGHPLIKAAGTTAIVNVAVACGYANVTQLVNKNCDYFSYNVIRKIKKAQQNEKVLNVLATIMKYSNMDILSSISDIIRDVLLETCDRFFQERNANAYLRVFQIFTKCLMKWLNITVNIEPIKSKSQKQQDYEEFKISNLAENINIDEDEGKTAKEMYTEVITKREQELEDDNYDSEEYEKPKPPDHIQLTVLLLQRCVNFLPLKNRNCKLLVIDTLKDGFEIIRDWENELLPLVHQVWSPLVERFKEIDDSLIINYSFQLLVILARLSKDFIRSRTAKDVLPHLIRILKDYSKLSYLQDKGSAYRYTQAYKLQLSLLQYLARVVIDLDLSDDHIVLTMEAVQPYLSNKQPLPLQEACLGFYQDLMKFDDDLVRKTLCTWNDETDYKRNAQNVLNM